MKTILRSLAALFILSVASDALAAPYVVTTGGQKILGTKIRAKRDGTVSLTLPGGTGAQEFPLGSYQEAYMDPPAEFTTARKQVLLGRYDDAIPALEKIMEDYQYLTVDLHAASLLGKAKLETGKAEEAIEMFKEMLRKRKNLLANPLVRWPYWEALIKNKQYDDVAPLLTKVIGSDKREEAAKAQILRGDISMAKKDYKEAVLDYLRTVILFKESRDAQPEALFKLGEALDQLQDPRAKKFYKKLVEEFPQTGYAAQAKAKI